MTQKPVMHFNCNLMITLKYKYNSESNIKTMYLQRHAFFLYLIFKEIKIFYKTDYWDVVKKNLKVTNQGGGFNPKFATKFFFLEKRKRCRMFWNRKICILMKKLRNMFIWTCFMLYTTLDLLYAY